MKHLRIFYTALLALLLSAFVLSGCQKEETADPEPEQKQKPVTCPFTDITWDNTLEDVIAAEGSEYTTYDSTYNGTTYAYPKSYLGLEGTVKYMFDGQNRLMCTAWAYSSDSEDDLNKTYTKIHKQVQDTYGESGYDASNPTSSGDVWYLDDGHIILSAVTTDAQKVLQYSYLNPEASGTDEAE